ncbi:MAG: SigE family RNA polymerase sigma factor [Acidimicrobiales bacterium]|jgi:RNA polymerase sigma-70 factor (ECF subfamily)
MDDFDEFFAEQHKSLLGQAFVLTGDLEESRDLVQEVFFRAWRKWDRVAAMDNPAAWARLVLRNLAIGRWRRLRGRSPNRPLAEGDRVESAPGIGHLDIARALRELPERQRTVLILHDLVGLSVNETALEIRAPEGSVRGWLSRGRRSLANTLELPAESRTKETEVK